MRRRRKLPRIISLLIIICTVAGAYIYFSNANANKKNADDKEVSILTSDDDQKAEKKRQEEEKAKQEAAKKQEEEKAKLKLWKENLETAVKNYLGKDISKVGFVYYDPKTEQKIAINEEKVFTAASTVKVQMNMVAYDWVKNGKLSLDEKLQYTSKDYEAGTGIIQGMDKSKPFTVQTLLDYSIKYSDNIATHMIQRRLGGGQAVRKMANEIAGTNTDTKDNDITAEEEFRLLKKLYENQRDPNYARLIEDMKNTAFHDRIDKYIPQEICAHKIGNYANFVNDVGIVYTPKPYIFVIYTEGLLGAKDKPVEEKIAGLSKLIYDAQLKK